MVKSDAQTPFLQYAPPPLIFVVGILLVFTGVNPGFVLAQEGVPPPITLRNNLWSQLVVPANSASTTIEDIYSEELPPGEYGQSWIVWRYDGAAGMYNDPGLSGTMANAIR